MKVRVVMPVVVLATAVLAAGSSHAQDPPPAAPGLVTMKPATAGDRTTLAIRVVTAGGASPADLNVIGNPEVVVINDRSGDGLSAGEGCQQLVQDDSGPSHRVACIIDKKGGEIARTLSVTLGDGRDFMKMEITGPDVVVDGGAGDDNLLAIDRPYPGYGLDDTTYPHPKANVQGGAGNDTLTIEGRRFTGAGNAGNDKLYLDELRGALTGGPGADSLTLRGWNGIALGGAGNDVLSATKGHFADLNGGSGNDRILGSQRDDVIVAGPGTDSVLTAAGKDKLFIRDGATDRVNCGGDDDVVTADSAMVDKVVMSCEQVRRPARKRPA